MGGGAPISWTPAPEATEEGVWVCVSPLFSVANGKIIAGYPR